MAKPIKITLLGDITDLAEKLGDGAKEIESFGKKAGKLALIGGGLVGAGLTAGLVEALDRDKNNDLLAAQVGATPEQARTLGQAAGRIFGDGLGESVEQINEGLKSLWQGGLVPAGATAQEIEGIGGKLLNVSKIMGEDLGPTAKTAGQMVKTGMAKDFDQAMDILVRGTQLGVNANEDLLDTFNEYSVQFKKVGMDGPTALGLMNQALKAGARDADVASDAIKEFSLRAIDGSTGSADAYKALGLNAKQMTATIAAGGPKAAEATQLVFDKMRALKDPVEKNTVAVGLFGTQAEDLGSALAAMDPKTAVKTLGDVARAAEKAGNTLNDNASTRLAAFGRQAQQVFVDVVDRYALPVIDKASAKFHTLGEAVSAGIDFVTRYRTPITAVAGVIGVILLPSLVAWGVTSTQAGAANVWAWATSTASATGGAASQVVAHWAVVGGWVKAGGQAAVSGAVVVGQWIMMGAESLVQAGRIAAAWLIAIGPAALVIAAVVAVALLIWQNWDKVKQWTAEAWDWVVAKIKQAVDFVVWLFLNFTGPGLLIKHWETIKAATAAAFQWVQDKARAGLDGVVNFFTSLPGRIVAAAGAVRDAGARIGGVVIDGISSGLSKLAGFASSLADAVRGAAKGAINGLIDLLNWAIPDKIGWGSFSINLPPNPIPKIRAMGGPASGLTRVGERGPEWVNLPRGSNVIPNHAAPVGGGVVVNVQTNADPFAIGREVAWALRVAPR
ncbi:phage tail tape measure protein [Streptomyces sp. NRRL S-350]|uniref:phage tail tape measure protein n=1 Tax=Streptomyces sp. NRRL S-350 TaxID=1463902 RepID=UPI0004C2A5D2|nr:phage tail tape measure protein [Streptomyces sp. NRRL S-350]